MIVLKTYWRFLVFGLNIKFEFVDIAWLNFVKFSQKRIYPLNYAFFETTLTFLILLKSEFYI